MNKRSLVERYTCFALYYAIGIILWGAFVRASGSGAGCGAHWPLCNGQVLPQIPKVATAIELTHRLTSGLMLLIVLYLNYLLKKNFPKRHKARQFGFLSLVFVVIEALIGAGIVLLRLVGENDSHLRAGYIALHLMNTLVLVAVLTATHFYTKNLDGLSDKLAVVSRKSLGIGLLFLMMVATSGAVVALGDTLFPHATLISGLKADFDPDAHLLIKLRVIHPVLSIISGMYWLQLITKLWGQSQNQRQRRHARSSAVMIILQWGLGLINLLLLAPIWMQIVHLLLANLLWIESVRLFLSSTSSEPVKPA